MKKLRGIAETLKLCLEATEREIENISYEENALECEKLNEAYELIEAAEEIIKYFGNPTAGEYTLYKGTDGKYTCEEKTYSCGTQIEYRYYYEDEEGKEKARWGLSTVEHDGKDYYIKEHKKINMEGLIIRVRKPYWLASRGELTPERKRKWKLKL